MYRLNSEDGISSGLIIWIAFIIIFFLLGIPAVLSVVFGLCSGVAVGMIVAYATAEKIDEVKESSVTEESPIQPVRRLVERLPVSKWRQRFSAPLKGKPPRRIGR